MAISSTSITVSEFDKFRERAANRAQLDCKKIPGFFLLKLKRGVAWRLRYSDPLGGKTEKGNLIRRTATIADGTKKPQEAAEIALEWRDDLKKGIDPQNRKKELQQAQLAERERTQADQFIMVGRYFEAIYSPWQHNHHRNARYTLNTIRNNFGHLFERRMDGLTAADVTAWYNRRRSEGIARTTLQRDYGAFKAMLNHAATPVDDAPPLLEFNPLHRVTLPKITLAEREAERQRKIEGKANRDLFSDDDKAAILLGLERFAEKVRKQRRNSRKHGKAHLPDLDAVTFAHWFIPFTHIAWLTGMRPGDIKTLKWENLEHNRFNGRTSLVFTPAKTQDKGETPIQVKFPVSGELADVLNLWREQQGNPQTGPVFPSERKSGALNSKSHRTPWLEVKRLGEVRENLDFYSFRHDFISRAVAKGLPVLTIAGLVGHRDGTMISQNYLRHDEHDSAEAIAQLGAGTGLNAGRMKRDPKEASA